MHNPGALFRPFFLPSPRGDLFCVHYPQQDEARQEAVIYAPPFAGEMNKARRMAALQSQQLASHGVGVLMIDLPGTGDSQGEFVQARWSDWIDCLLVAEQWLLAQGYRSLSLLGLRLGGCLALAAAERSSQRYKRLVWWQPIASGETFLTQFLRLRVASSIFASDGEKGVTTKDLLALLDQGQSVEVGGYLLHPELADGLAALRTCGFRTDSIERIDVVELLPDVDSGLSPAMRKQLSGWQAQGVVCDAHVISGDPFWSTQEITMCPELLRLTTELISGAN